MPGSPSVSSQPFGTLAFGEWVTLWTLDNGRGMSVGIADYGGIVVFVQVPDSKGNSGDVVLGFDSAQEYQDHSPYFGCITGRVANRIAGAQFELDGKVYRLAANNGANCLHGGVKGFDKVVWKVEPLPNAAAVRGALEALGSPGSGMAEGPRGVGLRLRYASPRLEEGFPGTLDTAVVYSVTANNQLRIDYMATTDQPTLVNLCNHSYFNLDPGSPSCLDHHLQILADHYTPMDEGSIPLGLLAPVKGTPFDFTTAKRIGAEINVSHEQLQRGCGYDHNFCLKKSQPGTLELAAVVRGPISGRVLRVYTTEPGVQLYTGNFLDGSFVGKGGAPVPHRAGFCLETQHYPDSVHRPDWPTIVLHPAETYRSTTVYEFDR